RGEKCGSTVCKKGTVCCNASCNVWIPFLRLCEKENTDSLATSFVCPRALRATRETADLTPRPLETGRRGWMNGIPCAACLALNSRDQGGKSGDLSFCVHKLLLWVGGYWAS